MNKYLLNRNGNLFLSALSSKQAMPNVQQGEVPAPSISRDINSITKLTVLSELNAQFSSDISLTLQRLSPRTEQTFCLYFIFLVQQRTFQLLGMLAKNEQLNSGIVLKSILRSEQMEIRCGQVRAINNIKIPLNLSLLMDESPNPGKHAMNVRAKSDKIHVIPLLLIIRYGK